MNFNLKLLKYLILLILFLKIIQPSVLWAKPIYFNQEGDRFSKQSQLLWESIKLSIVRNNLDSALHLLDSATIIAENKSSSHELAKLYNAKGIILKKNGLYQQALTAYKTSLQFKKEINNSLEIAKTLQNIGNLYRQMELPDSTIFYFNQSLKLKREIADTLSLANTLLNLGNFYFDQGKLNRALGHYKQANILAVKKQNKPLIAKVNNNIGSCYQNLGYYSLSNNYYFKALRLFNEIGMQVEEMNTLKNIATSFGQIENYDEALTYFLKLQEKTTHKHELEKSNWVKLNIADIYLFQQKPLLALRIINQIPLEQPNYSKEFLSSLYLGKGRIQSQLGNFKESEEILKECIQLKVITKDNLGLGRAYNNLAVMLFEKKDYQASFEAYKKVQYIAKEHNFLRLMNASTLGISEIFQRTNHIDSSYQYFKIFKSLQDSLFSLEKAQQIAELKEKYESDQKDKKISNLEFEYQLSKLGNERNLALISQQKSEQKVYLISVGAIFFLLIGVFIFYRQRLIITQIKVDEESKKHHKEINDLLEHQATKALEAMVEGKDVERKRIANELHDHFGSLLATVKMNLNSLENHDIPKVQNATELVSQACDDIRNLAHQLNVGISSDFGLLPAISELTRSLNQSGKIQVDFSNTLCDNMLNHELEIPIYRMIQELVSNTLKHAKASQISVQLTCFEQLVSIIVTDDGIGFDTNSTNTRVFGLGLNGLYRRVNEINGEIKIDSQVNKGTTVLIDIPMAS